MPCRPTSSHRAPTSWPPIPVAPASAPLPSCLLPAAHCRVGPRNPAWLGPHQPLPHQHWPRQFILSPGSTVLMSFPPCGGILPSPAPRPALQLAGLQAPLRSPGMPTPHLDPSTQDGTPRACPGPSCAASLGLGDVLHMQKPSVHGPHERGRFPSLHPRFSYTETRPGHSWSQHTDTGSFHPRLQSLHFTNQT